MGKYINKGNNAFRDIVSHEYVDKSSLISLINGTLNSEDRCDTGKCFIPNKEVGNLFLNAVEDTSWTRLVETLTASQYLLDATLSCNEQAVAKGVDKAHDENTSILAYNDENSLACVLSVAFIWAKNDYVIHREYATGKGYADLVMIPRRNVSKPALVIELKYNQCPETAISQIKQKNYPSKLADYTGEILLVGINYDKATKEHTCSIEEYKKTNSGDM